MRTPRGGTWIAVTVLAFALGAATVQAQDGSGRPPPPPMPPEALTACGGAAEGSACSFTAGDHSMTGTCRTGPDGGAMACLPAHPHGPPPEAFQACEGLAEGAACTVSFHGQQMTGTCRTGPDGGAVACAPPHPGHP